MAERQPNTRRRADGEGGSGVKEPLSRGGYLPDDLMLLALSNLPAPSLVRFRAACRKWLELTSDPSFTRQLTISGLFVEEWDEHRLDRPCLRRRLVPLAGRPSLAPDPSLRFMDEVIRGPFAIIHSCNGLLLCKGLQQPSRFSFYAVNPLTRQYDTIPTPPTALAWGEDSDVYLSFDPDRSRHYKVVASFFERSMDIAIPAMYQGAPHSIYSSESRSWRTSRFNIDLNAPCLPECAYWNGCLHWITDDGELFLSLNLDQDKMECKKGPILIGTSETEVVECLHIGESGGYLHVIIKGPEDGDADDFDVWRLGMGNSGWTKTYHIQLVSPAASIPDLLDFSWYRIMHFVDKEEGEGDGEPSVVVEFPGMLLAYHPSKETYTRLCRTGQCDVVAFPYNSKQISPLMVTNIDARQEQAVSGQQEGDI